MSNYKRKDGQKDFPDLEGKIINYINSEGKKLPVKVMGCNFDLGITLALATDNKNNQFCSHGSLSPNKSQYFPDTWEKEFYASVRMINYGTLTSGIATAILNDTGYTKIYTADYNHNFSCVFSS